MGPVQTLDDVRADTGLDRQRRLHARCGLSSQQLERRFPAAAVETSLPARFEEVARRWPDAVAVVAPHLELNYDELRRASNTIARQLLRRPSAGRRPIAVLTPQGPEYCAAMLGVLKAGTAVAPLDPVQTDERLRAIVTDVDAAAIVCHPGLIERVRTVADRRDVLPIHVAEQSEDAPDSIGSIRAESPAFIVFTSGSTGRPKGIIRSHRSQLHIVRTIVELFSVGPEDCWSGLHSPAWTSGTTDMCAALLTGATLCTWNAHADGLHGLTDWLNLNRLTMLSWSPSAVCSLMDAAPRDSQLSALRLMCVGNERLFAQDARRIMEFAPPDCVFANRLGSSEAGNFCHYFFDRQTEFRGNIVPAGYASPDRPIRIVDENGQDCAAGAAGEIVVCSRYLASGYWQEPELTDSRFRNVDGIPEFHTGDVGCLDADGCLEFLGRKDAQVKIRGQRVEPGDVEAVLRRLPDVREAAVLVRDESTNAPWLAAYYVSESDDDSTDRLRLELRQYLPTYLLPRFLVRVPALPRNTNHKLDRAALVALDPVTTVAVVADQPMSPLERELVAAWTEVLELPQLGLDEDFFELGGDSLKGMRMLARLATFLEEPPSVLELFEASTIRRFAELLREAFPEEVERFENLGAETTAQRWGDQ